jgi:hypothetical protein
MKPQQVDHRAAFAMRGLLMGEVDGDVGHGNGEMLVTQLATGKFNENILKPAGTGVRCGELSR